MKSRYEKMLELQDYWYRDIRDFDYYKNLWKKF